MNTTINSSRLFNASCFALITTAMSFGIRAKLMPVFGAEFQLSSEEVGWVAGTAFWGFTLAMIFGGPLVDIIGMKRIIWLAFIGHIIGIVATIMATGFWSLFFGTLAIGIGNGMVEAACNPLVATIFKDQKTTMLNRFHVWFPGGIVIGGLVSYLILDKLDLGWNLLMGMMFIPLVIYGFMFWGQKLPETERVASGVSTSDMFKATVRPLFIMMVLFMFLSAATELGTGQWIEALLGQVGVSAILLLVFINGIMALGRSFAGPVVHRLNPVGMLVFSAVFSCLGLIWLSYSSGYMAFAAAAVFAIGICYFWPTILGFVAEYIPKSGALGLSIIGGAGMLSVSFALPFIGNLYDSQVATAVTSGLSETAAQLEGGSNTLRYVAILPAFLIIAFGGLYLYGKNRTKEEIAA